MNILDQEVSGFIHSSQLSQGDQVTARGLFVERGREKDEKEKKDRKYRSEERKMKLKICCVRAEAL